MEIKYTTGFAGTGKSTELIKLLDTLPPETVVLCPTHKAIERLSEEYKGSLEMKTIHSLLGLIPRINEQAKHIGNIQSIIKLDNDLEEYKHIVIDEAGMISEEHFWDLIAKIEELEDTNPDFKPTLHLYMDPYQLLPVKGQQIMTDPATTTNLVTQYRSDSLDIVSAYTKFVQYLTGENTDDLTVVYSENIKKLDITDFKVGDRLLAYTNKAVGEWNQIIAKQLGIKGYEGQDVQLGNEGVFKCTKFIQPKLRKLLNAHSSGSLMLQNSRINKQFLAQSLDALITNPDIQFIDVKGLIVPVIVGIGTAKRVKDNAAKAAIKTRSKFQAVYALGRAYVMDYPFATTIHKAQGSEFERVFVDKLDIQQCIQGSYYATYARMMYVAISRCKRTLYV